MRSVIVWVCLSGLAACAHTTAATVREEGYAHPVRSSDKDLENEFNHCSDVAFESGYTTDGGLCSKRGDFIRGCLEERGWRKPRGLEPQRAATAGPAPAALSTP